MSFQELLELDRLARQDGKGYTSQRYLYTRLVARPGRHFVGIVGPRGVGKTVLLKQLASESEFGEYLRYGDLFEEYILVREGKGSIVVEIDGRGKGHERFKGISQRRNGSSSRIQIVSTRCESPLSWQDFSNLCRTG